MSPLILLPRRRHLSPHRVVLALSRPAHPSRPGVERGGAKSSVSCHPTLVVGKQAGDVAVSSVSSISSVLVQSPYRRASRPIETNGRGEVNRLVSASKQAGRFVSPGFSSRLSSRAAGRRAGRVSCVRYLIKQAGGGVFLLDVRSRPLPVWRTSVRYMDTVGLSSSLGFSCLFLVN